MRKKRHDLFLEVVHVLQLFEVGQNAALQVLTTRPFYFLRLRVCGRGADALGRPRTEQDPLLVRSVRPGSDSGQEEEGVEMEEEVDEEELALLDQDGLRELLERQRSFWERRIAKLQEEKAGVREELEKMMQAVVTSCCPE